MEECLNLSGSNPLNDTESATFAASLSRVIKLKIMPAVCVFGIVGNILNLTILTRRKLQKSFRTLERAANICLIALALSDLLICFLAFLTTFLPLKGRYDSEKGLLITYAIYSTAFINVFIMESTLLTVVMSLERYVAICFPLRQDWYMTPRRTKIVIALTFIFSILFNLPVFWRFKAVPVDQYVSNFTIISSVDNASLSTTQSLARTRSATDGPSVSGYNISNGYGLVGGAFLSECASQLSCTGSDAAAAANRANSGKLLQILTRPPSGKPIDELGIASNLTLLSSSSSPPSSPSSSSSSLSPTSRGLSLVFKNMTDGLAASQRATASNNAFTQSSVSEQQVSCYTVHEVLLADNSHADAAYRMTWLIAGNVLPLFLLMYFNVNLWYKIYLSYKMRREFYHRSGAQQQASTPRSSHIITVTLIAIVVMFLIFVAPSETVLYVKRHHIHDLDEETGDALENFFNLMQSINFSSNFILYCIISPYFRKALKSFMCCGFYNNYQVSKEFKKEFQTSLM